MKLDKNGRNAITILLSIIAFLLFLPLSNFLLKRQEIKVEGGIPEFRPVSTIMQNKCADCHTPSATIYPIYAQLPFAQGLIKSDIEAAQQNIVFSQENLSGVKPFSRVELARIQNVVENNQMPILPYKVMHWDAALTDADRAAFLAFVQAQAQKK